MQAPLPNGRLLEATNGPRGLRHVIFEYDAKCDDEDPLRKWVVRGVLLSCVYRLGPRVWNSGHVMQIVSRARLLAQ